MDSVKAARELVAAAEDVSDVEGAVRRIDEARRMLDAMGRRLAVDPNLAREAKFVDRAAEQLMMLSINLDGLKRRVR